MEMNPAVNHLSSFLLTNLLYDVLRTSAPARIINVASNAMTRSIDLNDLQNEKGTFAPILKPMRVYGQAKLAMVLFSYALARRLEGTGVTVDALHPGMSATNIIADAGPAFLRPLAPVFKWFLLAPGRRAMKRKGNLE